jgi:flagellar M-ring protein FliF
VAILALTGALLWWVFKPHQQLLFGNLREKDAAEIVSSLNEWKVPHEITENGASILVPADSVYETRMRLVSAGIPRGGHVGFELFDDADFGVTEFAQRVNYQRALQGELERTIASLPGVQAARVHLTIRRPGLFVGQQESSKASVALTLQAGESITRQQANGIRSLVASAVEGLSSDAVSVLDSNGALLAGGASINSASLDERGEEEDRVAARLQSRIAQLLGQVLRSEEFRVSVDVALNFDSVHQVSERPLLQSDGSALLVRKRTNSSDSADRNGRNQNQEDVEYAHGTAREEISRALGRIERVSIAIILPPSMDEFEVDRVRSLVAAAAGIDAERGDQLEVLRLGRSDRRWQSGVVLDATAAAPAHGASTAEAASAQPTRGIAGNFAAAKWLLAVAAGLLLGLIIALSLQRRPRALQPSEREAVLGKLRTWLAEEDVQP